MNEILDKLGDFVMVSADMIGNDIRQITLVTKKDIRQVINIIEASRKTTLEIYIEAVAEGTKVCFNNRYTVL